MMWIFSTRNSVCGFERLALPTVSRSRRLDRETSPSRTPTAARTCTWGRKPRRARRRTGSPRCLEKHFAILRLYGPTEPALTKRGDPAT
jgi:hypothetical protein